MFNIIENLKRAEPKRRVVILNKMHEKNIAYFERVNEMLATFLKVRGTAIYGIHVDDKFLEIYEALTRIRVHPDFKLLEYMQDLGALYHNGWVEKTMLGKLDRGDCPHGHITSKFFDFLFTPELLAKMDAGMIRLPKVNDTKSYSGPVVFLGVFTGLHIMSYLNKVDTRNILLIEPEADKFALSSYFFDYEEVEKQFGALKLHVGPDVPAAPLSDLVSQSPITASAWVRLLPAYRNDIFNSVLERISLNWRSMMEIYVPFDREVKNLVHGAKNVRAGYPFPCKTPELSSNATVVVVASGPSLINDIAWLKENQDRVVILASISCIRVLRQHGIEADFQCTLDTEIEDKMMDQLQLDYSTPLIAFYKINPDLLQRFGYAYLINEDGKANSVRFHNMFTNTHPTTGNLMTAVAVWMKPARLIFLGTDMGFRDAKQNHVKGGYHDDEDGKGHKEEVSYSEHLGVKANFESDKGPMFTISYYNAARSCIEATIKDLPNTLVFNCSDGAKIAGATALESKEFFPELYPHKNNDICAIEEAFSSDNAYHCHTATGKELLDQMCNSIMTHLKMKDKFNWPEFASKLDTVWKVTMFDCIAKFGEIRIEAYHKLVQDLLTDFYRAMLLTDKPEELYASSLVELEKILTTLPWDAELDE